MMMTPIDSLCYEARYYRRRKHHQHALVVNKKSTINHVFNSCSFMCAEKVEVVKEEGIRA